MGIFSLFTSDKAKTKAAKLQENEQFGDYLDKDFYESIINSSKTMILYFLQGKGWIGANKTFLRQ